MIHKQKMLFVFSLSLLWIGSLSLAENACPDWLMNREKNIPTCPDGGLVPETYPAGAVVVSDVGMNSVDSDFTADVAVKALVAGGDQNPLLIMPVSNETIDKVKSRIDAMSVSDDTKTKYKNSIMHVPVRGFTWQQDYFQPFVNPKTGTIFLREVQNYERHEDHFKKISNAVKACGFATGKTLKTGDFVSGNAGGNIETLPAGICLLGSDHFKNEKTWKTYADQICRPGEENRIKVPTSWLLVGHTDEIMKVVRNKNAKAPCDFSVVVASPNKALELLKANPNERFVDFPSSSREVASVRAVRRSTEYSALRDLCQRKIMKEKSIKKPKNADPQRTTTTSKILNMESLLLSKAQAGVSVMATNQHQLDCATMTNSEVLDLIESEQALKEYNKLVQAEMDSLKKEISQKLKNKLPQCETDFVEVPDLFMGGNLVEPEKGKYELPNNMGVSLLPNPTNAISINDTLISPDPSNGVFRRYIEKQYTDRGLKVDFVDTFDYAHVGNGNLHCATNTIHVCNPRGAKK